MTNRSEAQEYIAYVYLYMFAYMCVMCIYVCVYVYINYVGEYNADCYPNHADNTDASAETNAAKAAITVGHTNAGPTQS